MHIHMLAKYFSYEAGVDGPPYQELRERWAGRANGSIVSQNDINIVGRWKSHAQRQETGAPYMDIAVPGGAIHFHSSQDLFEQLIKLPGCKLAVASAVTAACFPQEDIPIWDRRAAAALMVLDQRTNIGYGTLFHEFWQNNMRRTWESYCGALGYLSGKFLCARISCERGLYVIARNNHWYLKGHGDQLKNKDILLEQINGWTSGRVKSDIRDRLRSAQGVVKTILNEARCRGDFIDRTIASFDEYELGENGMESFLYQAGRMTIRDLRIAAAICSESKESISSIMDCRKDFRDFQEQ